MSAANNNLVVAALSDMRPQQALASARARRKPLKSWIKVSRKAWTSLTTWVLTCVPICIFWHGHSSLGLLWNWMKTRLSSLLSANVILKRLPILKAWRSSIKNTAGHPKKVSEESRLLTLYTGQYFPTRVLLGGKLHSSESSSIISGASVEQKANTMKAAASLSFSSPYVQASASTSYETQNQKEEKSSHSSLRGSVTWQAQGGDTLLCNKFVEGLWLWTCNMLILVLIQSTRLVFYGRVILQLACRQGRQIFSFWMEWDDADEGF